MLKRLLIGFAVCFYSGILIAGEKAEPTFKEGEGRTVKSFEWGKVSAPKTAKPGEYIDFQIVLNADAVKKDQLLVLDVHGWKGKERVPGQGRSGRKPKVVPGVTTPYEASVKMPELEKGFDRITVVFSLSPDGEWANKTISGAVRVDYPKERE